MSFTIREYRPDDAGPMAALYFDAVRTIGVRAYSLDQVVAWASEPASPTMVQERAADGRKTLVAVNSTDEVIGYADLERKGHLDHLYCRPDVVGNGVGGALIDAILECARDWRLERVSVHASEIARPVFERKGFSLKERRDFTLRGVAIHNYRMEWVETGTGCVAKSSTNHPLRANGR